MPGNYGLKFVNSEIILHDWLSAGKFYFAYVPFRCAFPFRGFVENPNPHQFQPRVYAFCLTRARNRVGIAYVQDFLIYIYGIRDYR